MVIGQHGSWNRSTLSGYRVIFVPFENGRPAGPPKDILWGFLSDDEKVSYGRPVGVAIGPDKASLLVADDVGDVIWRVTAASSGGHPGPGLRAQLALDRQGDGLGRRIGECACHRRLKVGDDEIGADL
jgi:hypothetical protein